MNVRQIGCCRGNGKVFVKLSIQGIKEGSSLGITATGCNDRPCPCSLYEALDGADGSFVAVFPDLDIESVEYRVTSSDPSEEDSNPLKLSFNRAKWESRLNYRLKKELCAEIRDIDTKLFDDEAWVSFYQSIPVGQDAVVRAELRVAESISADFLPDFLDGALEPIDIEWHEMGKSISTNANAGYKKQAVWRYSFVIPSGLSRLIITFVAPDGKHLKYFACLDRGHVDMLNGQSSNMFENAQVDGRYPIWFNAQQRTPYELHGQREARFEEKPLFSIIVPVFNTPEEFLSDLVNSVLDQTYGSWELLLLNASPENAALTKQALGYSEADPRIKYIELESNMGISENTNVGIRNAKGDLICFADHDDTLEPDILYEYAKAINEHGDIDILYCDEDKLRPDGSYSDPFFKPDFSIDHLRDNNYICHMLTIRKSLLDQLELASSQYDGAQDHYLTLHASEKARRIHHVPRVLYHWRISETSTAADAGSKSYATDAGVRAVRKHIERSGIDAEVTAGPRPFTYKVTYGIPEPHPLVSIIIPSKDHAETLGTCINSIYEKTKYDNYEIVIVENNSTDPSTFEYYDKIAKEHDNLKVVSLEGMNGEFNFSKVINFGVSRCDGEYLLLLNNDTEVMTEGWVEDLLGFCSREDTGVVGCKLLYPDMTIQHAGVTINGWCAKHIFLNYPRGHWGYFAFADTARNLSAVTGACMMTKRSVFDEVGGFDEELAVAFNDIDYCLKVRETGKLVTFVPWVELIHYESLSRGDESGDEKRERFYRERQTIHARWAKYYVFGDPYLNINLSNDENRNAYYCLDL